jgi:hypothetical protein
MISDKVRSIIVLANMRAVVEKMLPIIDNTKLSDDVRKRAEKTMAKAAEIANRSEKELT